MSHRRTSAVSLPTVLFTKWLRRWCTTQLEGGMDLPATREGDWGGGLSTLQLGLRGRRYNLFSFILSMTKCERNCIQPRWHGTLVWRLGSNLTSWHNTKHYAMLSVGRHNEGRGSTCKNAGKREARTIFFIRQ